MTRPSAVSTAERPSAPALVWASLARSAPRVAWKRRLTQLALVLLAVPGAFWFVGIVRWAVSQGHTSTLALVAVHLAAVALAVGLPVSRPRADEGTAGFVGCLTTRYVDQLARLRALRRAVGLEVLLLAAQAPLAWLVFDSALRWGPAVTVAAAALWITWPLERVAAAQRAEGRRLVARAGADDE